MKAAVSTPLLIMAKAGMQEYTHSLCLNAKFYMHQ